MSFALRRRIEVLEQRAPSDGSPQGSWPRASNATILPVAMWAFPCGELGTPLEKEHGPDEWQKAFLQDLGKLLSQREFDGITPVDSIQLAVASGHGDRKVYAHRLDSLVDHVHTAEFKGLRYCQHAYTARKPLGRISSAGTSC